MIYVYWTLAVPTGLLASLVIILTLGGRPLSAATPAWLSLLVAAAVLGILVQSHGLATTGGKPGLAALLVVFSWVLFAGAMILNGLMSQKTWN
jgi:hypothetical protein